MKGLKKGRMNERINERYLVSTVDYLLDLTTNGR